MRHPERAFTRNSLINALSPADRALLQPHLTRVSVARGETLAAPNTAVASVYFPETALGSVVAISPEGHKIEASMVGWEGVTSLAVVHAADRSPHHVIAQVEGDAWRLSADAFRSAMARSASLVTMMLRFAQALYVQTTYTALSNANHGVEERLARWLLMSHDRSEGDDLALTHEFLGIMLAVRRPSVTTALHVLEGQHLIRSQRGRVLIRDRAGLEDFARDAYGIPEAEYARLVGPMPKAKELGQLARSRKASQRHVDALGGDPHD
jgi:CRP-like cAMP-binding protein